MDMQQGCKVFCLEGCKDIRISIRSASAHVELCPKSWILHDGGSNWTQLGYISCQYQQGNFT